MPVLYTASLVLNLMTSFQTCIHNLSKSSFSEPVQYFLVHVASGCQNTPQVYEALHVDQCCVLDLISRYQGARPRADIGRTKVSRTLVMAFRRLRSKKQPSHLQQTVIPATVLKSESNSMVTNMKLKSVRAMTHPCLTPLETGKGSDVEPFSTMCHHPIVEGLDDPDKLQWAVKFR